MITGVNHLTWTVNDIDATFDFYVGLLGMKPVMKSAISAYFLCGDLWIAVVKGKTKTREQYDHIAFSVDEDLFQASVEKMQAAGVLFWKENETEGDSVYFLDPSGNKMELHVGTLRSRIEEGKRNWGEDVAWYI